MSTQPGTDQLDAQRLWVKFRDADCGVYYSLTGGTMDMLNGSGCELAMTKERAESLEWVAQNGSE
ncbi:lysozyme inhibitor LprI family protein [Pseudomonas aeruginosa]|uniref:lysozyme inhibitor LprI family protein n=1 Tax=Pseudomonas aeruginosa TaxID=287 RepID=UPI0038577DEC